jgi:ABC-type molybdate transport system permease subunit
VLLFGANSLLGQLAQEPRHQDPVRRAGHRAGHRLRHLPLRRPRTDPADAGTGNGDEEAALSLGASGWQTFWYVTLPNIKWGLLYGVLLCNARAMGEFGAVSVVSGHIRGLTNTMPLQVEILYNEYNFTGAFAVARCLPCWRSSPCLENAARNALQRRDRRQPAALKGIRMEVRVQNIRKEFDRFPALHDVSLDIRPAN